MQPLRHEQWPLRHEQEDRHTAVPQSMSSLGDCTNDNRKAEESRYRCIISLVVGSNGSKECIKTGHISI